MGRKNLSSFDERVYSLRETVVVRDARPGRYLSSFALLLYGLFCASVVIATLVAILQRAGIGDVGANAVPVPWLSVFSAHGWNVVRLFYQNITQNAIWLVLIHYTNGLFAGTFALIAFGFAIHSITNTFGYFVLGNLISDKMGSGRFATVDEILAAKVHLNDGVYIGFIPAPFFHPIWRNAVLHRMYLWASRFMRILPGVANIPALQTFLEGGAYIEEHPELCDSRIRLFAPASYHNILIGPTETGKTQGIMHPTNYQWSGSLVGYCLKEEVCVRSAGHRWKEFGSDVHVIFLAKPDQDDIRIAGAYGSPWEGAINPLDVVVSFDTAQEITNALSGEHEVKGGADQFFSTLANETLSMVMTWLRYTHQSNARLGLVQQLVGGAVKFDDLLKEIIMNPHDSFGRECWQMPDGSFVNQDPILLAIANKIKNAATGDQQKSITTLASVQMSVFQQSYVDRATSCTTFNPLLMRAPHNKNISVYIYAPFSQKNSLQPATRAILQGFVRMFAVGDVPGKSAIGRCLVEIDEADSLGTIETVSKDINEVRSKGVSFLLGFQGYPQVMRRYGVDGKEAVTQACNSQIFFRVNDQDTGEMVSRRIGGSTTRSAGPPNRNENQGSEFNDAQRNVVEAYEMEILPNDRAIVFLKVELPNGGTLRPLYLHRSRSYNDPIFRHAFSAKAPWEIHAGIGMETPKTAWERISDMGEQPTA